MPSTQANLDGFEPGQTYQIRIRAFNAKGKSAYTRPVTVRLPRS